MREAAQRCASGAAGSRGEAEAVSRRLHAVVRPSRCTRPDGLDDTRTRIVRAVSHLPSFSR
jgi:hypothetical protein